MRQPMHELVAELRKAGFTITSATKEMSSQIPLMKIVSPGGDELLVKETEYFANPDGLCDNIRLQFRQRGYRT